MEMEVFENIPLFAELSSKEIRGLLEFSEKRKYPRGSIVVYRGDVGDVLYLIMKGKVKVVLSSQDGKEIILNTLQAGNYFGEMSVLDHMPRSATVVTMENCEFLVITRKVLTDQIEGNPEVALKLLSEMSRRLRETDEQINSLAHLDVRGRLAQTLLKLLKKTDTRKEETYQVIPRPTMKDLADMTGTSRETVSRILREFSKKGIISLKKNSIIIYQGLDMDDD